MLQIEKPGDRGVGTEGGSIHDQRGGEREETSEGLTTCGVGHERELNGFAVARE